MTIFHKYNAYQYYYPITNNFQKTLAKYQLSGKVLVRNNR